MGHTGGVWVLAGPLINSKKTFCDLLMALGVEPLGIGLGRKCSVPELRPDLDLFALLEGNGCYKG